MSIPEVTKKYLETAKQKQSTQEIIDALEKGGLPPMIEQGTCDRVARRRYVRGRDWHGWVWKCGDLDMRNRLFYWAAMRWKRAKAAPTLCARS